MARLDCVSRLFISNLLHLDSPGTCARDVVVSLSLNCARIYDFCADGQCAPAAESAAAAAANMQRARMRTSRSHPNPIGWRDLHTAEHLYSHFTASRAAFIGVWSVVVSPWNSSHRRRAECCIIPVDWLRLKLCPFLTAKQYHYSALLRRLQLYTP
jgi:hypothetical protein